MESFGFDREDVKGSSFDKFSGEKNKVYNVCFAFEDPKDFFVGAQQHFAQKLQKGWQCLSTANSKEVCCTQDYDGNDPKWKLATIIVIYKMDGDKIVDIERVIPWTFSASRFEDLKKIFKRFGHVDIELTCTDAKFQNFTMLPGTQATWMKDEKAKAAVNAQVATLKPNLTKLLSKRISAAEIREHLGLGSEGAEDTSAGLDLGSIAGNLGD